jgi:hypothetical protein
MLIEEKNMLSTENNELFAEVSNEESAVVSGGGPASYLTYFLLSLSPASPGGLTITPGEVQDGWNILINAGIPVNGLISA